MKNKPHKPQEVYPTILESFGILALVLTFLFTGQMIGISAFHSYFSLSFLVAYITAMSLAIFVIGRYANHRNNFSSQLIHFQNWKTILLILCATIIFDLGIIIPISFFLPISESLRSGLEYSLGSMDIWMLIAMVFAAPFFEEYIFRGIMLKGLSYNQPKGPALILSSILFGIMHLNLPQFVTATLGGLYIGWIFLKSENLGYCIFIHFIINAIAYLALKKFGVTACLDFDFREYFGSTWAIIAIMITSTVIFFLLLRLIEKSLQDNP